MKLQSSISNLHGEGLKSHEIMLKSYDYGSNNIELTEITQNYMRSMIS